MQIELYDQVILDEQSMRITRDGYLVADARTARTGIQEYRARELGLTDRDPDAVVRVYRPADEVFAADALASLAHRPITMDHPTEAVTADNWKKYARGITGAEVVRDGEFVRQPLMLTDAEAIRDVKSGKKQLSQGYSCELEMRDGETPEGLKYDAVQKSIRGNHLAVCSVARGGPALRIGDERRETSSPKDGVDSMPHVLMIDGLQVPNVSDEAKAAIERLQRDLKTVTDAKAEADTQVATLTTDKATLEAKVTTLEKQVTDAKLTPAQLRDAAKSYAAVVDKAKALGVTVTDSMDEVAIQRAVVAAKIGDAAKDWNDAQVAASFATLTKDAAPADPLRKVIASAPVGVVDTASIRDAARAARVN